MRKAQAAMEFLMTYGWAILVVLAAIAALAYFGVLSPSKMLPETATGFTGLMPVGKPVASASDGYIALTLANNFGSTINITGGTYNGTCDTTLYFCDKGNTTCTRSTKQVENGEEFTIRAECTDLQNVDREKGDVVINYIDMNTGLPGKVTGTIQVQPK
ncbi:hypothetical protein J7K74_02105 [Candidatus Woesearchaeota archaeon]|nr:hypothetical protein [Candidatus Woesearchaeota archaeon]